MDNRKMKKAVGIVALVLAVLMVLTLFTSILYSMAGLSSDKSALKGLKDKLSGITSQKKEVQGEIDALTDEIDQTMAKKIGVEEEISLTMEQIRLTQAIIDQLDVDIEEKNQELAATELTQERQYENFKKRIRAQYETGDSSTLSMILSSQSLTELLVRVEDLSRIASYDKKLLEELEETMAYIEELREGLEADKLDQEQQKADLGNYQDELEKQNIELDLILDQLDQQIVLSQDALDKINEEEDTINGEILALSAKIAAEEAAAAAAAAKQNQSSNAGKYTGGVMKWPLPGYYSISSDFAMRYHPITGKYSQHTGIDLPAPKGTKIIAAADGTVVAAGYNSAYGERVILSHGGGVQTLYGHMTSYCVSEGDTVKAGDVIGYVGSTGNSTGNHLHFSVLVNGSYVDPKSYVSG